MNDHNADSKLAEVLLKFQPLIDGYENIKMILSGKQELGILQCSGSVGNGEGVLPLR